jgi:KUP system potassium uptake protein
VSIPAAASPRPRHSRSIAHHPTGSLATLTLGALGVVFGDIGTSPLYALKECLGGPHGFGTAPATVLGVLSLIFWAITLVVTVKYLAFVMRADNKGEGGIFALLALVVERRRRAEHRHIGGLVVVALLGAALLYGDGVITPAISVLSAVEGLEVFTPRLRPTVVPITCAILLGLFLLQRRGTDDVGRVFGPVMVVWFVVLGALGVVHIARAPEVLAALSPLHAVQFFRAHGVHGFIVLGAVVLAVTGGEALYADMGHFGRRAIRAAWLGLAMPALVLSYFGQGALLLRNPAAVGNPFYAMVPPGPLAIALVVLATLATIIASQALISGAFSLTHQGVQLGYLPRVTIKHTSDLAVGQIYVPEVNWALAIGSIGMVVAFQRATGLAAAYGVAVTGTMAITSIVYFHVARHRWGWSPLLAVPLLVAFLALDLPFFGANLLKIAHGGWVPLAIGAVLLVVMLIWKRGRIILAEYLARAPAISRLPDLIEGRLAARVPGAAIFMVSDPSHVPPILLHHVARIRVLHQTVVLLTIITERVPTVDDETRCEVTDLGRGCYQLIAHYGFMEKPDVPALLAAAVEGGQLQLDLAETTYYLQRETFLATDKGEMGHISESVYAFLARNAADAARHFNIPPLQALELGTQLDL